MQIWVNSSDVKACLERCQKFKHLSNFLYTDFVVFNTMSKAIKKAPEALWANFSHVRDSAHCPPVADICVTCIITLSQMILTKINEYIDIFTCQNKEKQTKQTILNSYLKKHFFPTCFIVKEKKNLEDYPSHSFLSHKHRRNLLGCIHGYLHGCKMLLSCRDSLCFSQPKLFDSAVKHNNQHINLFAWKCALLTLLDASAKCWMSSDWVLSALMRLWPSLCCCIMLPLCQASQFSHFCSYDVKPSVALQRKGYVNM